MRSIGFCHIEWTTGGPGGSSNVKYKQVNRKKQPNRGGSEANVQVQGGRTQLPGSREGRVTANRPPPPPSVLQGSAPVFSGRDRRRPGATGHGFYTQTSER